MANQRVRSLRPCPTFVMPYYGWRLRDRDYLDQAIAGLYAQTDQDWQLIIVDDASPLAETRNHARALSERLGERVLLVSEPINRGAGFCRNVAIRHACQAGAPFVLFQDSDDISHPDRLRTVRTLFEGGSRISVIYSTFTVIDEDGRPVQASSLTASVREIIEAHKIDPPEGDGCEVMVQIAVRTGYATLTSTVAVRSEMALAHPFPVEWVSEDSHTWLRYAAAADLFVYAPAIPTRYRIPQDCAGSSVRTRVGPSFYPEKARVETDGFLQGLDIAARRGRIDPTHHPRLLAEFHSRMALTMRREEQVVLADSLLAKAADLFAAAGHKFGAGQSPRVHAE